MPLRDILIFFIVFSGLCFVFRRPHVGIYLFSWLGYMNPHRLSWGVAYNFPFSMIVGAVTILATFIYRRKNPLPKNPAVFFWFLFILWVCISTVLAIDPFVSVIELKRFLKIQVMIFLTLILITNRKELDGLVWVIVFSLGIFYGVKGGFFTILTGGKFMVLGPPDSFISGNTEIGFSLCIVLPLVYYLMRTVRNRWLKSGLFFSLFLIGFGIVGTTSRGAFLAAGILMAYVWLKTPKKMISGFIILIAAIGILSFMPEKYFEKMNTIKTYEEDASAMGRINAWMFALNLAMDRPVSGGGFGSFQPHLFYLYAPDPEDFHDAHSIYFEVLAEQGYVGLIFFLFTGFFSFRNCQAVIKLTRDFDDLGWGNILAKSLQASFVSYATGGAFLGLAYFDLPYHIFAMTVILKLIIERELIQKREMAKCVE